MSEIVGSAIVAMDRIDKSSEEIGRIIGMIGANHLDSMIEAKFTLSRYAGGTGEFPFLFKSEKSEIAEISARHIDGRCKLMVQTSGRTEDVSFGSAAAVEQAPPDIAI
jgi:dihydrodipicolinate synthase/N-acetylneuraminate lyase